MRTVGDGDARKAQSGPASESPGQLSSLMTRSYPSHDHHWHDGKQDLLVLDVTVTLRRGLPGVLHAVTCSESISKLELEAGCT